MLVFQTIEIRPFRIEYRIEHTSDVLRLAVVSKAGGMYADIDIICLRDVSSLRNYIGLAVS